MKRKLKCIMLIDDNEDDNYIHELILNEEHAAEHIVVTESGFDALEYLQTSKVIPDLIFLDINMPKMNGWEFLDEYNQTGLHKTSQVIIIMLTTSMNPADAEQARKNKIVSGFETKPLSHEMLRKIFLKYFEKAAGM
jgi:CheY-like chemotaxis protein